MATIYHLPDELLDEIVCHLDKTRRRGDFGRGWDAECNGAKDIPKNPLLRFCLVSRRFLRVGEPVLYSFFSNGMDEQMYPHTIRRKFLHRIIQRPDLAARVTEVRFDVMEDDIGSVTRPRRTMYGIVGYADEGSDDDSDAESDRNYRNFAEDGGHAESDEEEEEEEEDETAILNLNSRADRLAFTTAAYQVEMQNKSSWLEDLRAGNPYAELVLLLCQASNLKRLVLRVPDKSGYDFNYRNLRMLLNQVERNHACGKTDGPLRSLHTLQIEYAEEKVNSVMALGFPAQYMRDFLMIPSLQELHGYMISTRSRYTEGFETDSDMDPEDADGPFALFDHSSPPDDEDDGDDDEPGPDNHLAQPAAKPTAPAWPNRTSRIHTLALTSANITQDTLHQLLSSCAALTRLHLSWAADDLASAAAASGQSLFHPPTILAALALHAPSLVSLTLHADHPLYTSSDASVLGDHYHAAAAAAAFSSAPSPLSLLPPLGSLAPFAALRRLSVSGLLLTGAMHRDPVTVLTRAGRRVRRWVTRPPSSSSSSSSLSCGGEEEEEEEGWRALADVFPPGLEELAIACPAQVGEPVCRFLTPLVVEIARGIGADGRLPALRRLELEGGWGRKVAPGRQADICALLRGSGVVLVLDGRAYGPMDQEVLIILSMKLQCSMDRLYAAHRAQLEKQLSRSARKELERAGVWDEINLDLR